jgi:hypothetical protein
MTKEKIFHTIGNIIYAMLIILLIWVAISFIEVILVLIGRTNYHVWNFYQIFEGILGEPGF